MIVPTEMTLLQWLKGQKHYLLLQTALNRRNIFNSRWWVRGKLQTEDQVKRRIKRFGLLPVSKDMNIKYAPRLTGLELWHSNLSAKKFFV